MTRQMIYILGGGFSGAYLAHRLGQLDFDVSVIDPTIFKRLSARREITLGIGQSGHLHVLLKSGLDRMRRHYPDFQSFLRQTGCPEIDWAENTTWHGPFGKAPIYSSNIRTHSISRPHLDHFMVNALANRKNIHFIEKRVWKINVHKQRVDAIELSDGSSIEARNVIDCRGRGSDIIENLGIPQGKRKRIEIQLKVDILYRTIVLEGLDTHTQVYEQPWPPGTSDGAVLTPIEFGRTILTLIHFGKSPTSKLPLEAALQQLKNKAFSEAITNATSHSSMRSFHFCGGIRRSFSKYANFPKGLAILGDACVQFNPVFGQGMSVSAQCVDTSVSHLMQTASLDGMQRLIEKEIHMPWLLSSSQPGTLANSLLGFILRHSFQTAERHQRFLEVQHLINHPISLVIQRTTPEQNV